MRWITRLLVVLPFVLLLACDKTSVVVIEDTDPDIVIEHVYHQIVEEDTTPDVIIEEDTTPDVVYTTIYVEDTTPEIIREYYSDAADLPVLTWVDSAGGSTMPKKFSDLSAAANMALADVLAITQGGTSKQLSGTNLVGSPALQAAAAQSGFVELATEDEVRLAVDALRALTSATLARGGFDISRVLNLVEDWLNNSVAGQLGWTTYVSGTNAAVNPGPQSENGSKTFGTIEFETGTDTNSLANIHLTTPEEAFVLDDGPMKYVAKWRPLVLSDSGQRYTMYLGLGDNIVGTDFNNGIYFRYSDNIASGNWQICTASGATRTQNDSGVAVTTSYVDLRWELNADATSVEFFINGTSVGTITTNIPATQMDLVGTMIKATGTTLRRSYLDYVGLRKVWTGGRI